MPKKPGTYINALFALPPNTLALCGSRKAQTALEEFLMGGDVIAAQEQLRTFRNLWPHLQYIAGVLGDDPFDARPAECYWLGHPAIFKGFNPTNYLDLIKLLEVQPEIPSAYIDELRAHLPKVVYPFHTWKVIREAKYNGGTLEGINNCMVAWGRVKEIDASKNEAQVNLAQMTETNGKLRIHTVLVKLAFNPKIVTGLKHGSYVAAHWGNIVMKITVIAAQRIEKATTEVLKIQDEI